MEDLIREAGPVEVHDQRRPMRAVTIFAALALVVAGVVLARHSADPVVHDSKVVVDSPQIDSVGGAIGQTLGLGASAQAQISVAAIVCPILNALASGPFGSFIGPIIAALRVAFGCASP